MGAIFGLHVWPFLPSGTLGSRAGALMGACQQFQITIRGRGGHAAMPHTVIDPIVASSHVIIALQVRVMPCSQHNSEWLACGSNVGIICDVRQICCTESTVQHNSILQHM